MAINVFWSNLEQTALVIRYKKPWTWAEFDTARNDMLILLNEISHSVMLILDVREAGLPPDGAFRRFKEVSDINHPNVGKLLFVAPRYITQFIKSLTRVLMTVYPNNLVYRKFIFVGTLEEALALIPEIDDHASGR